MRQKQNSTLDDQFINRWSPRAFQKNVIPESDLATLFEAAQWSPSCFNEQPWFFVYAQEKPAFDRILAILDEGNQIWAKEASVLLIVFAKKEFEKTAKPNRWAAFDSGAAWMSLALQAEKLGYRCHGMGGYNQEKSYEIAEVDPQKYESICAIALGKEGTKEALPEKLQEMESPNQRKPAQVKKLST